MFIKEVLTKCLLPQLGLPLNGVTGQVSENWGPLGCVLWLRGWWQPSGPAQSPGQALVGRACMLLSSCWGLQAFSTEQAMPPSVVLDSSGCGRAALWQDPPPPCPHFRLPQESCCQSAAHSITPATPPHQTPHVSGCSEILINNPGVRIKTQNNYIYIYYVYMYIYTYICCQGSPCYFSSSKAVQFAMCFCGGSEDNLLLTCVCTHTHFRLLHGVLEGDHWLLEEMFIM